MIEIYILTLSPLSIPACQGVRSDHLFNFPSAVQRTFTGRTKGEDVQWERRNSRGVRSGGSSHAISRPSLNCVERHPKAESAFFRDVRYYPLEGP